MGHYRILKGNTAFKGPMPWIDVLAYGADPTGAADSAAAITAAIAAAAVGGGRGIPVYLPPGVYKIASTITIPNYVVLRGAGPRQTLINYTGTGTAISFTATQYGGLEGVRLAPAASATGVGILLTHTTGNWCDYNTLRDIELTAPSITSGQIGLKLIGDGADETCFNYFENFTINLFDQPIVMSGSVEANEFVRFHIDDFGTGATGIGVALGCTASTFLAFWFGRGTSTATALNCFDGAGSANMIQVIADVGAGKAVNLSGDHNNVRAKTIGTTTYGTIGAAYESWGMSRGNSTYENDFNSLTGDDRSIAEFGVLSYSNGFTVDYTNSPQAMLYSFRKGDVYVVDHAYTGGRLRLGSYYFWVNASGILMVKNGAPSSDSDGTSVGATASFSSSGDADVVTINKTHTGAGEGLDVANAGTGNGILVTQTGNGVGVHIHHSGDNHGLHIDKTAGGSYALAVSHAGTYDAVNIHSTGTGDALSITADSGIPFEIQSHKWTYGTDAPGSGTWAQGDIVFDSTPSASGYLGWVCTAGGSPGTWKTFGAISS